jgi:alkanesulfonate monooxygenase SsuD/methylene tetrahydromethanopterin reductase-like flavin-dependent oxidoreductase (luciferase family)
VRFGFYLPTRGRTAGPEAIEAMVAHGESLGFSSVIADHLVFPVAIDSKYPYTVSGAFPGQGDALDQLSLMTFVAGKSRRLRLISSVMILPHRNPVVTAKMLATIDVLSAGRVTVGVGVGWLREEFSALSAFDFDRRGAVSDEYLRFFKTLWTQDPASALRPGAGRGRRGRAAPVHRKSAGHRRRHWHLRRPGRERADLRLPRRNPRREPRPHGPLRAPDPLLDPLPRREGYAPSWGSRRSRSPSPSRFAPSTTSEIASPGIVASHHAFDR